MTSAHLIGHTLDAKYQIERELGRGGMGTVYLGTHLGTERPVAVKVIAQQYMERPEFVERFRREARAAGRLRHPNVVNVTDFGFAETPDGRAAYLVMEYLDGCTLGEILEEEKNLPVGWTLDILEQVCSAVHAAHEQGIIHRDLKPDNIWLEPNQRGGYTVKVLDFGIAKLEDTRIRNGDRSIDISVSPDPTQFAAGRNTIGFAESDSTLHDGVTSTRAFESRTLAQVPDGSEARTAILPVAAPDPDTIGTRLISENQGDSLADGLTAGDLTRVGAVIGTPLYMSPEQCRSERLDARSDIYSLGVIGYQMLSGRTPFEGDFTYVMEAHKLLPPPPLPKKKVRKKLKRVIQNALSKDAADRPQSAEAFAILLRARSEGILGLLRRASMIYSEHMPKFLILSGFFFIPMVILTASLMGLTIVRAAEVANQTVANVLLGVNGILLGVSATLCTYLIAGTITWIVSQNLAIPLRPLRLRAALKEAKRKWKTFAGTGLLATLIPIISSVFTSIPVFLVLFGIVGAIIGFGSTAAIAAAIVGVAVGFAAYCLASILLMPIAAVVMMENKRGREAIRRSIQLIRRSLVTAFAAFLIVFLLPAIGAGMLSSLVNLTAKALGQETSKVEVIEQSAADTPPAEGEPPIRTEIDKENGKFTFGIGNNRAVRINGEQKDIQTRVKEAGLETLTQLLLLPLQIVLTSFTAIIVALLYIKTRQAGGESLEDLLGKFEETEHPRKKWQERVRNRLIQSGRITSRPSNETSNP